MTTSSYFDPVGVWTTGLPDIWALAWPKQSRDHWATYTGRWYLNENNKTNLTSQFLNSIYFYIYMVYVQFSVQNCKLQFSVQNCFVKTECPKLFGSYTRTYLYTCLWRKAMNKWQNKIISVLSPEWSMSGPISIIAVHLTWSRIKNRHILPFPQRKGRV